MTVGMARTWWKILDKDERESERLTTREIPLIGCCKGTADQQRNTQRAYVEEVRADRVGTALLGLDSRVHASGTGGDDQLLGGSLSELWSGGSAARCNLALIDRAALEVVYCSLQKLTSGSMFGCWSGASGRLLSKPPFGSQAEGRADQLQIASSSDPCSYSTGVGAVPVPRGLALAHWSL